MFQHSLILTISLRPLIEHESFDPKALHARLDFAINEQEKAQSHRFPQSLSLCSSQSSGCGTEMNAQRSGDRSAGAMREISERRWL